MRRGPLWSWCVLGMWFLTPLPVMAEETEVVPAASAQENDTESVSDAPREGRSGRSEARGRSGPWRERREDPDRPEGRAAEGRPFGGGRGPGFGGEPREESFDFLTAEEREELLAFAQEHFPEVHKRLTSASPSERRRFFHQVGWRMLRLLRLQRHDPELADKLIAEQKIEMALMELRRDYLDFPSEPARNTVKAKIRQLMETRFDLRQARLELEIRELERRVVAARERLAKQEESKSQILDLEIDRFIDELEGRSTWDLPPDADSPLPGGPPPGGPGPLNLPGRPGRSSD